MAVSCSGRTASSLYLGLRVMICTPCVVRVDLGARAAVWKRRQRPSVENTANSRSSIRRRAAARGDLSENAPVSRLRRVWVL